MVSSRYVVVSWVAFLCAGCGGAVAADGSSEQQTDPASVARTNVTEADAAAAAPPSERHFVCRVQLAMNAEDLECTTLDDGGASYTDFDGMDCRTYYLGAGQGCVPPMTCRAIVDGETVDGACVDAP